MCYFVLGFWKSNSKLLCYTGIVWTNCTLLRLSKNCLAASSCKMVNLFVHDQTTSNTRSFGEQGLYYPTGVPYKPLLQHIHIRMQYIVFGVVDLFCLFETS